jgi:Cu/Ag efflux protein CusF
MNQRLIAWSIRNRLLVLSLAAVLAVGGVYAANSGAGVEERPDTLPREGGAGPKKPSSEKPVGGAADKDKGAVHFYCPLHPDIIRHKAGEKCPVCYFPLVRRRLPLGKLDPKGERLADAQGYRCPVTGEGLDRGRKGPPVKVVLKGQPVVLCCEGCKRQALAHPHKTLARVAEWKATQKAYDLFYVRAALAKLGAAERRLAEAQVFCPVVTENRLGSMGPPVKVVLKGRSVLLCCPACEEAARSDPDRTLARVDKFQAEAKAEREYQAKGVVRSIDAKKQRVLLSHEAIPGVLGAVEMDYPVRDATALKGLQQGDRVRFRLKTKGSDFIVTHLEKR